MIEPSGRSSCKSLKYAHLGFRTRHQREFNRLARAPDQQMEPQTIKVAPLAGDVASEPRNTPPCSVSVDKFGNAGCECCRIPLPAESPPRRFVRSCSF